MITDSTRRPQRNPRLERRLEHRPDCLLATSAFGRCPCLPPRITSTTPCQIRAGHDHSTDEEIAGTHTAIVVSSCSGAFAKPKGMWMSVSAHGRRCSGTVGIAGPSPEPGSWQSWEPREVKLLGLWHARFMNVFTSTIEIGSSRQRELIDITAQVRAEVGASGVTNGVCSLYAHGATAALMVQENDDPNLPVDVVHCLEHLVPDGKWLHDRIDSNGAAHIQAGIVGPSETIPVRDGKLALSTWQNIFLCEFDGPRRVRRILVTVLGAG